MQITITTDEGMVLDTVTMPGILADLRANWPDNDPEAAPDAVTLDELVDAVADAVRCAWGPDITARRAARSASRAALPNATLPVAAE